MIRKSAILLMICCLLFSCVFSAFAAEMETDPDCTTTAVDNSTDLPDGVYTPEFFTFSGGTGKVSITCPEVTVQDGLATATLVFSSSSYAYVKASGLICYADVQEKTAVFQIPIALNRNNTIFGLTTKMSTPHEIEYTIYASLVAGNADIPGLTFVEEIPTDSEDVRLSRYEEEIYLLELVNDAAEGTEGNPYDQPIIRYLILPEGAELPAGTEASFIVLRPDAVSIYADNGILRQLAERELESRVTVVPEAEDDSRASAGNMDQLSYRILIVQKTDLILADSLPGTEVTDRLFGFEIPLLADFSGIAPAAWDMVLTLLFP